MKKRLTALLLVLVILLMSFPVFVSAGNTGVIVKVKNYANVRSKANDNPSSKVLGTVKRGSEVTILGTSGKYTKIQFKSGVGFVYSDYIDTNYKAPDKSKSIKITDTCNVYKSNSTGSGKLGVAKAGEYYEKLGETNGWYKIQYTSSEVGYVAKASSGKETPAGTDTPETGYGYVTGNTVNVRSGASSSATKKDIAKKNEVYEIVAKNGKWYKIKFDGQELYIHGDYFKKVTSETGKKATVINCNESVNVRAGNTTSSKKIGTADLNKSFTYLKTSGNYVMIIFKGKVGCIYKTFAKIA